MLLQVPSLNTQNSPIAGIVEVIHESASHQADYSAAFCEPYVHMVAGSGVESVNPNSCHPDCVLNLWCFSPRLMYGDSYKAYSFSKLRLDIV